MIGVNQKSLANHWSNRQRKLQGECHYRYGTCDWRTISVFGDDEDFVDKSQQPLEIGQSRINNNKTPKDRSSSDPTIQHGSIDILRPRNRRVSQGLDQATRLDWKSYNL